MIRSLNLEYLKENTINSIQTYEYHLPKNIFFNSKLNPNNEGFYDKKEYLGDGVQNIRKCRGDMPMYASLPHFLNADNKFLEAVDGLVPEIIKHDFILNVEPVIYCEFIF